MPAAIDVQQHTWQRAPRSAFAMHPALPPALYQPGSLQGQFHPGVAQCNLVLGAQLLMKMSHVQIEILLPVESESVPPAPWGLAGETASPAVDRTARHSRTLRSAPANDACAAR